MKKYLTLILLAATALSAWAENYDRQTFNLTNSLVGASLVGNTNTSTTYKLDARDYKQATFYLKYTGDTSACTNAVTVYFAAGMGDTAEWLTQTNYALTVIGRGATTVVGYTNVDLAGLSWFMPAYTTNAHHSSGSVSSLTNWYSTKGYTKDR